mgnify:CR=1 FL=1
MRSDPIYTHTGSPLTAEAAYIQGWNERGVEIDRHEAEERLEAAGQAGRTLAGILDRIEAVAPWPLVEVFDGDAAA